MTMTKQAVISRLSVPLKMIVPRDACEVASCFSTFSDCWSAAPLKIKQECSSLYIYTEWIDIALFIALYFVKLNQMIFISISDVAVHQCYVTTTKCQYL